MRVFATRFLGIVTLAACCAAPALATQYPPGPGGACPDSATIFQIQNPADPCHPAVGDTVRGVGGIITGFDNKPSGFGFYIQNNGPGANGSPWRGIDVFTGGTAIGGLAQGDSVVVTLGRTAEFSGGTEITAANGAFGSNLVLRKISSGNPLPAFHVGTVNELNQLIANPNAEQWEGCLVRVNGPMRVARSTTMPFPNVFLAVDNIVCPDGSIGPCDSLFVDGNTLTTYAAPPNGAIVNLVQGIYEERDYSLTQGYQIMLRDGNDIVVAGTPPSLTDAFPLYDNNLTLGARLDSIMVVFDRAVEKTSAENTANYSLGSFGSVNGALRLDAPNDHRVLLEIQNGLNDGDNESITVNNVEGLANGVAMTSPESRDFYNGVLTIGTVQAPDPAALAGAPCEDRSRFAGPGSVPGDRFTFRGVVTKSFGPLYYLQDGQNPRSGMSEYAPISSLTIGHQYLVAGSVQEFFGETEAVENVYLRDEGAAAVPGPVVQTIAVLRDSTCDSGQSLDTGEDYEGMLVTVEKAEVAAFNNPPRDPSPGGSFYIFQGSDTMFVNAAGGLTFDADTMHTVTVTGVLRWYFNFFTLFPRGDADIIDYGVGQLGVDDGVAKEISFAVYPNPARNSQVRFSLPRADQVELSVYDLAGRKVVELANGRYPAGTYTRSWNGLDSRGKAVNSGVFFYHLKVGSETRVLRGVKLN